eukprot:g9240.t1
MRGSICWTPILRECGSRRRTTGTAAGEETLDAFDTASFCAVPREQAEADAHPLALPRVKQRARRATSTTTTARRRPAPAPAASRSSSAPATNVVGAGDAELDLFSAAFGGSSNNTASAASAAPAAPAAPAAAGKGRSDSRASDDPLSQLWLPAPAVVPESAGGNGDSGLADSGPTPLPEDKAPLFDDDGRDVKVAAAGLSDDPLTIMMQERAVARNIARHGGVVHDDVDDMTPGSPTSTDAMSVLGGGRSSLGDSEVGGSSASATARAGGGQGGPSDGSGEEVGAGWGKNWAAHRRSILREFDGVSEGVSGADESGGPAAPTTRVAARLEELEGPAEGGGGKGGKGDNSGGGGGGGGGGGRNAKNVAGRSMAGGLLLTPYEYRTHVGGLQSELETAWANEEKVAALKVTVQAAKLLGDVSVPSFYPALFASVAGLLEAFGVMVFERIRSRAEDPGEEATPPPPRGGKEDPQSLAEDASVAAKAPARNDLPKGWTCDDIGAIARETCRNWFYKTACIRELLPRILIEAALLPCYRFLATEDEFGQILGRLSTLVRGVGDPMVAVYCRCFIAAAGAKIAPRETAHAVASLQDYLFSLQEVQHGKLDLYLRTSRLGKAEYLHLQAPAVDWLLGIVGPGAPRDVFTTILTHYRNHCGSLEMLRLIVKHFGPEHYAPFALEMAVLIKKGHGVSTRCTAAEVMGLLGRKLGGGGSALIAGAEAIPLLNEAWQEIAPAPLDVYMEGAAAWLGVLLRCPAYGPDEVAILVEEVTCRMEEASAPQLTSVQGRLADGVVSALACAEDPLALQAAGAHVVKILAALDKSRRVQACLDLLAAFLRSLPPPAPAPRTACSCLPPPPPPPPAAAAAWTEAAAKSGSGDIGRAGPGGERRAENGAHASEADLARAVVGVAKLLHDSLDLLSSHERQRQSAVDLTCDMVDRHGMGGGGGGGRGKASGGAADEGGGSGEASRLALLAECRQAFWGMDEVTDRLVLAAVGLSVRAWRAGSNATARAALCFCSLTVPSVPSALRRLALLQLCASTALQVGKPSLADALFRSAICVVPECSPLVISGADAGLGRGSTHGSGGIHRSPTGSNVDRKSYASLEGVISGGGGGGGAGDGGWGPSPSMPAGLFGMGGRREHAGAWLLCDAVKSLLGALVAAPGHPDLGPFYLLRGLLKAIRSLPWPAGSGLLASLYITAAGSLCIMWQERLPYSVGTAALAGVSSTDGLSQGGGSGNDSSNDDAAAADTTTATTAGAGASGSGGGVGGSATAVATSGTSGSGHVVLANTDSASVPASSPPPTVAGTTDDQGNPRLESVLDAAPTGGEEGSGGGGGGSTVSPTKVARDGEVPAAATTGEGWAGDGDVAAAAAATAAASTISSEQQPEDGAGPEREKSWLDVGGVLGTDDLYLRSSAYLEELQQLLRDVVMATMKELEELREQGEIEPASAIGDDHARMARLRYGRLALDLANQLVSNVKMEGGAASVVTFLIEAAARAGARESAVGRGGGGGGGTRGQRSRTAANYFEATVTFVGRVANDRLARLAKSGRETEEKEEQEEAWLSLLQGLSGFGAPLG